MGVIEKNDFSSVTIGDFAVQALLTATFHEAFLNDKFFGEESSADLENNSALLDRVWSTLQRISVEKLCKIPDSAEQMYELIHLCGLGVPGGEGAGRVWVFDPIDGTKISSRVTCMLSTLLS